jgi:hypothetical protein
MSQADPELVALQERWSPGWKIWRAQVRGGIPNGSYCASLIDDSAGVTPFLMARSPRALNASLEAQDAAAAGRPYNSDSLEPPLMS